MLTLLPLRRWMEALYLKTMRQHRGRRYRIVTLWWDPPDETTSIIIVVVVRAMVVVHIVTSQVLLRFHWQLPAWCLHLPLSLLLPYQLGLMILLLLLLLLPSMGMMVGNSSFGGCILLAADRSRIMQGSSWSTPATADTTDACSGGIVVFFSSGCFGRFSSRSGHGCNGIHALVLFSAGLGYTDSTGQ